MLERSERVFRIICLALGALLLFQVINVVLRRNPLGGLTIPPLPTLTAAANSPVGLAVTKSAAGTAAVTNGTNLAQAASSGKNTPSAKPSLKPATNGPPVELTATQTNLTSPSQLASATNSLTAPEPAKGASNAVHTTEAARTSPQPDKNPGKAATNSNLLSAGKGKNPPRQEPALTGMSPMMGPGAGKAAPELPLAILARVVKITESEILGPVMHPLPMGLLGIAGNVAFLRSPNGQTGVAKEGDEVGSLKLLRIGTNRVLVELDGKKSELTIFSGLGGESLLPKSQEP
jgi:hypothetical protein